MYKLTIFSKDVSEWDILEGEGDVIANYHLKLSSVIEELNNKSIVRSVSELLNYGFEEDSVSYIDEYGMVNIIEDDQGLPNINGSYISLYTFKVERLSPIVNLSEVLNYVAN